MVISTGAQVVELGDGPADRMIATVGAYGQKGRERFTALPIDEIATGSHVRYYFGAQAFIGTPL
jgi:hypothetical protein